MTGTFLAFAASTIEAATSPLCGMTTSTSTPCVRRVSACCLCTRSSPLADWTRHSAAPPRAQRAPARQEQVAVALPALLLERVHREADADRPLLRAAIIGLLPRLLD